MISKQSGKCAIEIKLNETASPLVKTSKRWKDQMLLGLTQLPLKRLRVCLTGCLNGTIGPLRNIRALFLSLLNKTQNKNKAFLKEICGYDFFPSTVNPNKIHRNPAELLRKWYQQKHYHFRLKGIETVQNKKTPAGPEILSGSKTRNIYILGKCHVKIGIMPWHDKELSEVNSEARNRGFPNIFRGSMVLLTLWSRSPELLGNKFLLFKPLGLWYFIIAA